MGPEFFPNDAKQLAKDGPCEPPLVVRLEAGRTIRGRVVDVKGRPIAGARVTPEFRGRSDLLGWRAETDAEGRFQWPNAPLEVVVLKVVNPAESQKVRLPGARCERQRDRPDDAGPVPPAGEGRRRRDRPADRSVPAHRG